MTLCLSAVQFTYLLQTQWFRDAPVERDAIQALYFAAGAAGIKSGCFAQSVSVYLEIDLFAREIARQLGLLLGIHVELFL